MAVQYQGPPNPLFMRSDLTRDEVRNNYNNTPSGNSKNITGTPPGSFSFAGVGGGGGGADFFNGIGPGRPIPPSSGIPNALGRLPGSSTIKHDAGAQTVDDVNEKPVNRSLMHKAWVGVPGLAPNEGDRKPFLGHELQLIPGDLVYVAHPLYQPGDHDQHLSIVGDIAKVNSVIASQYYKMQDDLKKPGWVLGVPGRNVSTAIHNMRSKDILNFIYRRVVADNINHLGIRPSGDIDKMVQDYLRRMSFYDLVEDASLLYERASPMDDPLSDSSSDVEDLNSSTSDSDSSMDLNVRAAPTSPTTRQQRITQLKRPFNAWPAEYDIYCVHKEFYGKARDYTENPLQQYCMEQDELAIHVEEVVAALNAQYNDDKEVLGGAEVDFGNYFGNLTHYQKLCLRRLFRLALTEMLGVLDTYVPYCTMAGIRDMWNFFGVFNNAGTGNRPDTSLGPTSPVGNYVIAGPARSINRAGCELPPGTRIWHYLTKNTPHDSYCLKVWNSTPFTDKHMAEKTDSPPPNMLTFVDRNGDVMNGGMPIYIGAVRWYYQDHVDPEKRRIINGIGDPAKNSRVVPYAQSYSDKLGLTNNWLHIYVRQ